MSGNASAGLIWSIAELLRGDYKQADYGKVILPFTLLRRLDCVLAPTKDAVLTEHKDKQSYGPLLDHFLREASGYTFYNTSHSISSGTSCGGSREK